MRRLLHILLPLAIVLSGLVSSSAFALTEEEKVKLLDAVNEGRDAYQDGRFLDAVEAFERAEKIAPNTRVQFNLARALEEAGECKRATARFEDLAKNPDAEKAVKERAQSKVDNGVECTSQGDVAFTCETPEATITFDGESIECGESVRVEVGEKVWKASKRGFMPASGKISAVESETVTVVIGLSPPPPPKSNWMALAGFGLVTAGTGLVAVGLVSDSTANDRSQEIIDASADGDRDRLATLQDISQSARTRTLVLYSTGAALAVGGGVLLFLHYNDGEDEDQEMVVSPTITPDGVGAEARWRW